MSKTNTVTWPRKNKPANPPHEKDDASARLYLEALLGDDYSDSKPFPGSECIECGSDNVDVRDYSWACRDCDSSGTIKIRVTTTCRGARAPE